MRATSIEIANVEKKYGEVFAVKDLNLSVKASEFIALLGPSGCGKTTTLRMIAGLDTPSAGAIRVNGKMINDTPVHKRNFGMVFQNLALFPHKTVFQNIAFGLQYRNVDKVEIARRVKRALDVVRLPRMDDRLPSQLSGGQQQRVAVARAIVIEPDLLLFDEPLSALDANLREEMRYELKRIQRDLGITTVFVTHDQAEALSMADKVVVMRNGGMEQEGTPDEVYSRPQTEFVARFFGIVNEVRGRPVGHDGTGTLVDIGVSSPVQINLPDLSNPQRLLIRAERIRISKTPLARAASSVIDGVVTSYDFLGLTVRYVVKAGDQQFDVIQPREGELLGVGDTVQVSLPHDGWVAV